MSVTCDWELQKALYNRLIATDALTALLAEGAAGVHDHVPVGAPFPYVVIAEAESAFHGTQDTAGRETIFTLHAYGRKSGLREVRDILAALHAALDDAPLTVTGQHVVMCRALAGLSRLEGDGETRRASLRLRIVTEPDA